MAAPTRILVLILVSLVSLFLNSSAQPPDEVVAVLKPQTVTYDGRSLILNGTRQIFFSGSIHYTRSPPEMWADLIQKAKAGGLNVISTYVFWNVHEPVEGQFTFEGDYDLVKFIRLIEQQGLYCILRIGPFIQAEWNHGGLPYWLREIPDMTFRSYNEPFMKYTKRYCETVINLMKKEKLFAPQGGPIILAQIENEYNMVQRSFRENGPKYVKWVADLAVSLYPDVPWVMCKQYDAPDNVISTCNGRHCGDTWGGSNGPDKPILWTENWTAQFRSFGDPPSQRSAEDIAYGVARFFAKNGTLNNYYMYHGGTNFGRTTAAFTTTRYYDEAPIDEFGLVREPKWGHLRDLHRALRLSKKALLWGIPSIQRVDPDLEITIYEQPGTDVCAAFLTNNRSKIPATINFRGSEFYVPPESISILPDCKTVVYNTMTIVSQHNARNFLPSQVSSNLKWEAYTEKIPTPDQLPQKFREPLELYTLKKDVSDYAWYGTSISFDRQDLPMRPDILPVLRIMNLGHAMIAFVNGEFIGFGHGSHTENKFVFDRPISLKVGQNTIVLLCMTVGLPDSGSYLERRYAGVRGVTIQGLNTGTLDITLNQWSHLVGIEGEKLQIFTDEGSRKVQWVPALENAAPVTWFKTTFDAPEGTNPVALRMFSMQKGMIWVNGRSVGRYWSSFRSPIGIPSQSEYHIPRAFLKPKDNLLVIFEETGGKINEVQVQTVNRDTVCSYITEFHPPAVKSWERTQNQFKPVVEDVKSGAQLICPAGKIISAVEFTSFGDPMGVCGTYMLGNCNSPNSQKVAEQYCLGKNKCAIPLEREVFDEPGKDTCPNVSKSLAVQVKCSLPKP